MSNFFKIFEKYLLILIEPSIVLIVGLLTVLVTRNSNKHNVARDRLTYAYHPIFLIAKPYYFKSIEKSYAKEFIEEYNKVEKEYSLYIYPSLRHRVDLLSVALKSDCDQISIDEHWMMICNYIERDYDKLCRISHMPIRSTAYRLNNNQFSSKPSLYWGMFKLFFLPLVTFFMVWIIFLLLVTTTDFLLK